MNGDDPDEPVSRSAMPEIDQNTPVAKVAALVSQALEAAGIEATLSGGGAVSIFSANAYESRDLDFVTSAGGPAIERAIARLGFHRRSRLAREFDHPTSPWYVEFPPGPLAFGDTVVDHRDVPMLHTPYGPLRIVTPTHIIMDRLAAYKHWKDEQSWDQAVWVAERQHIDWPAPERWAHDEGIDAVAVHRLRRAAGEVGT
ncbi:MAG: hypothetical protein OXS50_03055 [Gammaproteobacteria bacterium]|nr:hypothetical protein [Gammaproteobacteria bacterium]